MPRFTFEEQPIKSRKLTANALYKETRAAKIKNPRFKVGFISQLSRESFTNSVYALIKIYKKTGSLKCACCNSSEAYFTIHVDNQHKIKLRPMVVTANGAEVLTVDHNLLKTLGGENSVENYTPLCYTCNQLRGSRFAEFNDFLHWYKNNPDKKPNDVSFMSANFCHVNFCENMTNASQFETLRNATSLPPELVNKMKKGMRTPVSNVFSHLPIKI